MSKNQKSKAKSTPVDIITIISHQQFMKRLTICTSRSIFVIVFDRLSAVSLAQVTRLRDFCCSIILLKIRKKSGCFGPSYASALACVNSKPRKFVSVTLSGDCTHILPRGALLLFHASALLRGCGSHFHN
jgi:hypothetical protein